MTRNPNFTVEWYTLKGAKEHLQKYMCSLSIWWSRSGDDNWSVIKSISKPFRSIPIADTLTQITVITICFCSMIAAGSKSKLNWSTHWQDHWICRECLRLKVIWKPFPAQIHHHMPGWPLVFFSFFFFFGLLLDNFLLISVRVRVRYAPNCL